MEFVRKTLTPILAGLAILAMSAAAFAYPGTATVAGALAPGYTGLDCGQPVKIDVNLPTNTVLDGLNLAVPPLSASFRVIYTTDSLTFVGLEGGILGAELTYSIEYPTVNPNEVYRIVTGKNYSNAALTGKLYTVVFALKGDGYKPYSVSFSDDMTTVTPMLGIDTKSTPPAAPHPYPVNWPQFDMPDAFNNTGIQNIGAGTTAATACGIATVTTSIVPLAGPCGGNFDMPITVVSNTTNQYPVSFAFQVVYDTAQIDYVGVSDADLGTVYASPQTPISGTLVYRTLSTFGVPGTTHATPVCCVVTFNQIGTFPFTVTAQDEPASSPLVADFTYKDMYHVFDNTASTGVAGVPCTSVDDWMLFGTPGDI